MTLAIIGVVAALTIPAVVTKATKDRYVTGLKKAYNTLKQVERESIRANGEIANWDFSTDALTIFDTYFRPYFDTVKYCGLRAEGSTDCFADEYTKIGGEPWDFRPNELGGQLPKIITADGMSFAIVLETNAGHKQVAMIWVDVNGRKPPNRLGGDLFIFNLYKGIGIRPGGAYNSATGVVEKSSAVDAECKTGGSYCAAKVLSEGAMNY